MSIPPVFRAFVAATRDSFNYLVAEYGFHLTDQQTFGYEAWIIYDSSKTRITVHYELGSEPWVEIGRLEIRDGEVIQPSSISLDLLLEERNAPMADHVAKPRDFAAEQMDQMISGRAERLRKYGEDVLLGDFRGFPKLLAKAEEELRDREKEFFGE